MIKMARRFGITHTRLVCRLGLLCCIAGVHLERNMHSGAGRSISEECVGVMVLQVSPIAQTCASFGRDGVSSWCRSRRLRRLFTFAKLLLPLA